MNHSLDVFLPHFVTLPIFVGRKSRFEIVSASPFLFTVAMLDCRLH